MFRTALAALAAVCLSAQISCTQDEAVEATPSAPPPVQRAASGDQAIVVKCALDDAIEPEVRRAVVQQANTFIAQLRDGRHDTIWDALHPQAQRPEDRQAFLETLVNLQGRLESASQGQTQVERVALGSIAGGVNDIARVVCRDADKADGPPALTLLANAGGEDIAYVSVLIPGPVYEHAAVVQMRKRDRWHLLGLQVHPSRFHGKSAVDWVKMASSLRQAQKLVPSYAALAMAGAMASRGASVTTPISVAIETDLQTMRDQPLFIAETKTWTVDGQDFNLHGLSLASTQTDVSLVVKYVNEGGLVEEFVGRDADKLMEYVRAEYPELKDIVDAVIFEAFAKAPEAAGPTIQAYRVARFF